MKNHIEVIYWILDLLNLWWSGAWEYYYEKSEGVEINCYCRRNKYTGRKYFRTIRPSLGWIDNNEWLEYEELKFNKL